MTRQSTIIVILFIFAIYFYAPAAFAQDAAQPLPTTEATATVPQLMPAPTEPAPMPLSKPQIMPMPEDKGDEIRDFVDPREIKDILRQIKDLKRETNRLIKKAKKSNLTVEINQLNEVLLQVANLETNLKNTSSGSIDREILQDFYDAQIWDKLNDIRVKIELPNEIKMIEKEIKKLEKMMAKKSFAIEGVDLEKIKAKIEAVKNAIEQAKNYLAQENLEDARESMQSIYEEGAHPGEIMGVVGRISEITRQLKKIKSEEIKNDIKEVLQPIYDAINFEDYREANMILNEIDQDLRRIFNAARYKPQVNEDLRNRMQKLEEKLQMKMQLEQKDFEDVKMEKQSYYDKRYSGSLLGNIFDALLGWLK